MDAGPAGWGRPLYERVLDAVGVAAGTSLLDVGCGAGQLCRLAADRGVSVTGVDADPVQLARAAALVPEAELHRADLHALPQPDRLAEAVSCVQVLMHLPSPVAALREIVRVAAPGAAVAVTVWGPPQRCAVGAFGAALAPLLGAPPRQPSDRASPPPLSADGRLAKLAALAGLDVCQTEDVCCPFEYPDQRTVLAGLFASELGRRALARAGTRHVRRAVLAGLAPYRVAGGGYRLDNTFRLLLARRAPA